LIWKFQEDGYTYTVTPEEMDITINVQDLKKNHDDQTTASHHFAETSRSNKNPIGNQQDEIHQLKEKSN
jgi:hypothetical protein